MSEENLPAFGIRGLCSPDQPFSILEISAKQYDASILSYPESALTWHDDDDGETVTVGSGWELSERLKDPIPSTNPCIKYRQQWTGAVRDQYIHLFDISQSQTSLDVWREHEAYFSKTQTSTKSSLEPTLEGQPKALEVDSENEHMAGDLEDMSKIEENAPETSLQPIQGNQRINAVVDMPARATVPGLMEGLGFQLDHLAGFLRGTSDSLRKAAEKTRETDTSPIEDVLSGMTTILGEVGAFGLEVIEKMSEETPETENNTSTTSVSATESYPASQASSDSLRSSTYKYLSEIGRLTNCSFDQHDDTDQKCRAICEHLLGDEQPLHEMIMSQDVDSHDLRRRVSDKSVLLDLQRTALIQLLALNTLESMESMELATVANSDFDKSNHNTQAREHQRKQLLQLNIALQAKSSGRDVADLLQGLLAFNIPDERTATATATHPSSQQTPILDQDSEAIDAAFSVRYPPLMSLRKSKTFEILRPDPAVDMLSQRSGSIRVDHMGQPRPQIFDAETQRRSDFARMCYPGQEYTPGPTPTSRSLARPKGATMTSTEEIEPAIESMDDTNSIQTQDFAGGKTGSHTKATEKSSYQIAPGKTGVDLLPEVETGVDSPLLMKTPGPLTKMMGESSSQSSLRQRQIQIVNSRTEPSFGTDDKTASIPAPPRSSYHRLQRHRSLASPGLSQKPTFGLHRSQSLTASNPAARLNGPFSPTFPALVNPKPIGDQKHSEPTVVTGPVRNLHRSVSDRRPRSLYEPYRSANAHRVFEPVWEGQPTLPPKETDPNPGVVIIDASNFEPGTSEQDIRDLLADDCRTVIGINTLISCRIIATEPEVMAKLVIKDKTNADAVIDKYNNKWINGRPLKFEYSKTGIDARINRLRGAFPTTSPRHLRSVPDLRTASSPKTPFPKFVSQPKPIPQSKPLVEPAKQSLPPTPLPSQPVLPPAFAGNLIHECEKQLMTMGYGLKDPTMLSRLHVYACAANGDVHEAIEMIEDDKKANDFEAFYKKISDAREERWGKNKDEESSDGSDAYNKDLERALKLSMEQK